MAVLEIKGDASTAAEDGHLPPILAEADCYLPRFARAVASAKAMGGRTSSVAALAEEVAVHMDLALFRASLDDKVDTHVVPIGFGGPGTVSALDYAECWMADQVRAVSFSIQGTVLPVGVVCRSDGGIFLTRMELCGRIDVAAQGTIREVADVVEALASILLEMMPRHSVN